MTKGIVYKITNLINGKSYIGITKKTFHKRYNHRKDWWNAPSVNRCVKSAIKKYGKENFNVEIVEKCPTEVLEEREIFYIKYYNSFNNGYNLTTGGNYNYSLSEETKNKVSKTIKDQFKNGRKVWNKGKKLSKNHLENVIKTKKLRYKSGKIKPWNKGKKIGPMCKQAVINSAKAHKKPVVQKNLDGTIIKIYEGLIDTKQNGFNPSLVSRCCKQQLKTHKGYVWEYKLNE